MGQAELSRSGPHRTDPAASAVVRYRRAARHATAPCEDGTEPGVARYARRMGIARGIAYRADVPRLGRTPPFACSVARTVRDRPDQRTRAIPSAEKVRTEPARV